MLRQKRSFVTINEIIDIISVIPVSTVWRKLTFFPFCVFGIRRIFAQIGDQLKNESVTESPLLSKWSFVVPFPACTNVLTPSLDSVLTFLKVRSDMPQEGSAFPTPWFGFEPWSEGHKFICLLI